MLLLITVLSDRRNVFSSTWWASAAFLLVAARVAFTTIVGVVVNVVDVSFISGDTC